MQTGRILRTVRHLRLRQLVYQVWYRIYRPRYVRTALPRGTVTGSRATVAPIPKPRSWDGQAFCFLNVRAEIADWNDSSRGMLWCYNLNYMDWLGQEGLSLQEGLRWIDRFIDALPHNRIGQDPYPTALRVLNWIKFFDHWKQHPATAAADAAQYDRLTALYSQVRLLERRLEFHLLGNHLLEDLYALYVAAVYFQDARLYRKAGRLLRKELDEEVLPDGAHYEQSPMYHCILLDRLLDCINYSALATGLPQQEATLQFLSHKATRMLGHLQAMLYADGSLPLSNDSALGIAPTTQEIFDYARRLGLTWEAAAPGECGYRKAANRQMEAVLDIGQIAATYQAGHTHADTFHYELRTDGRPFIVDTGISTYDKTPRRQYERSTAAHNTVVVQGRDSSEVWGGFRVGSRCRVHIEQDTPGQWQARHTGTARQAWHRRRFTLTETAFTVDDETSPHLPAISYIHLAPGVTIRHTDGHTFTTSAGTIAVEGADHIEQLSTQVAQTYNRLEPNITLALHYRGHLSYSITC